MRGWYNYFRRYLLLLLVFSAMVDIHAQDMHQPRLIVIAHRGASGFRPEHTLASYRLAIEQGADFIEPDLVVTRDGVLIARHENEIGGTTDVADHPEFADRKTTKIIDGVAVEGWFSEDFSLAEIKTLRARERLPELRPQNTRYDGQFTIPTLREIIALVREAAARSGRSVGIYPETKHPTFFQTEGRFLDGAPINLSLGKLLMQTLVAERFTDPERIYIQSFEFHNLIELQQRIMPEFGVDLPLIQLYGDIVGDQGQFSRPYDMLFNAARGEDLSRIYGNLLGGIDGGITASTGYRDLIGARFLTAIAETYAEGIGPWKESLVLRADEQNANGRPKQRTRLTGAIHPFLSNALGAGLQVHPYTLRAEPGFLAIHANGVPQTIGGEIIQLLGLGVHGFFIDQPVDGVRGRDAFLELNR